MRKFGERLRAARVLKGISQLELGLECDLSQTYLSQTEAGKRNISLVNMALLARTLGVPLTSLVEGIEGNEEQG